MIHLDPQQQFELNSKRQKYEALQKRIFTTNELVEHFAAILKGQKERARKLLDEILLLEQGQLPFDLDTHTEEEHTA